MRKEDDMEYRIIHKSVFFIVGLKKRITLQFTGENHQIDSLYEKLTDKVEEELLSLNDTDPEGIISVSANFADRTKEGSFLDQYLAVASTSNNATDFDILSVPSSDWAVFTTEGSYPEALQNTWAEIYSKWLPSSGYELTGGPEILVNISKDTSRKDFKSEIWIPVKMK